MRHRLLLLLALAAGCKNITAGVPEPGTMGAGCAAEGDCARVAAPVCLQMPGGYCSATCLASGEDACDEASICEALGDRAWYCLDGCLTTNGNRDCREGYRCSPRPEVVNLDGSEVGVCLPRCATDVDCEQGLRCDVPSGDCLAAGERAAGEPCEDATACNGGLCLRGEAFRGGYCSARCGTQFLGCEPGARCVELDDTAVCLATCDDDADCRAREGYVCRRVGARRDAQGEAQSVSACAPRCRADAECDPGEHCDAASGGCVEGPGAPDPVGTFCARDADCASNDCATAWPDGYCTAGCADGGCPDGAVCGETRDGRRCLAACAGDLDCRPGYVCREGGCAPPCRDADDCPGGLACSPATGRCVAREAGAPEIRRVDVARDFAVGPDPSAPLTLTVPEGTVGFSILAEGAGADYMVIAEMTDPTGRRLYDFEDPFRSDVRFFPSDDVITQSVPSGARTAPIPGDYVFTLVKEGGETPVDVRAYLKLATGEPDTGRLDVNFVFAEAAGLDAARAQADAKFQQAVAELGRIWAAGGVQLGRVSYCDLPAADRARYAAVDSIEGPRSELAQMFRLSGRLGELGCNPEPALNFFLVDEIVGGLEGYIILGIAGGIPGPPGLNGTTHSGVAVTMAGYARNPVQLAQTMAHEGGHFLGLFHTTEAEGTAFDPLADTPECASERDSDADGVVSYEECDGAGRDNLMFWAAGATAETLTPEQGFVLVRNPGIR